MNVPDGAGDCEGDGDGDGCGFLTAGADPAAAVGGPSIVTPRHSTIVAADVTVRRFMSRRPPRTHADARGRHRPVVYSAPAGPRIGLRPGHHSTSKTAPACRPTAKPRRHRVPNFGGMRTNT